MYKKVFLTLLIISLSNFTVNAQIDTVLNRYRQLLFQTKQQHDIPKLISSLNNSGYWSDIDYSNENRAEWQMMEHLQRVQEMSVAWSNPASDYFHQKRLKTTIDNALNYWLYHRFYNPNWWYNEIGVPRYMRNIIILLRHHLSKYQRTRSLEELGQYRINGTGSNLIWSAELGFFYGALSNDTTWMRHCIDTIFHEIRINTGEGIQPDYSFHMHGNRLQIYSYGTAYLSEVVKLALECKGTVWAFPENKIKLLTDFVLKGWQWMARGINTVPGTIDRSISRKGALHAADIRNLIPGLIKLDPQKSEELIELKNRQNGNGKPLDGFRYYPYSDFMAYQCKNFSFFLKTISTRTLPSESINGENLKGFLLNDGDGYLIHDGSEYYNLMPVWNWNKIPGITGFKGALKIAKKSFVGSVSNGESGLTSMDYVMEGNDVTQKIHLHKIWICHDQTVVCLITELTVKNITGNIYTVLDQSRLNGPVIVNSISNKIKRGNHTLNKAKWLYHNGFTYFMLQPSTVELYSGITKGNWHSINSSESDSIVVDSVFMPLLVQRDQPANISSGYVLTYSGRASRAEDFAKKPSWKILKNDSTRQIVRFKDDNLFAAFFDPDSIQLSNDLQIKISRPCLMMLSKNNLYVSDPTHRGGMIKITLNQHEINTKIPSNGTSKKIVITSMNE